MTISWLGEGAAASTTGTALSVAHPTFALRTGDLRVVPVALAHSDPAQDVGTPAGWTKVATIHGGGGTYGNAAGPRRLAVFVKEIADGETIGNVAFPVASEAGSAAVGRMSVLRKSALSSLWEVVGYLGEDATVDTAYSITTTNPGLAVDDVVFTPSAWANTGVSPSSTGSSLPGGVFGTWTADSAVATTAGNDVEVYGAHAWVLAANADADVTVTRTLSAASGAVGGLLRIREAQTHAGVDVPHVAVQAFAEQVGGESRLHEVFPQVLLRDAGGEARLHEVFVQVLDAAVSGAAAPPTEDEPGTAAALPVDESTVTTDTTGATTGANEPTAGGTNTAWYSVTPTTEDAITVDTAGSDYATQVAVYEGTVDYAAADYGLTLVAADSNPTSTVGGAKVTFKPTPNTTYYVQVGGKTGGGAAQVARRAAGVGGSWGAVRV